MTTPRVTVPVEPTDEMMLAADTVDWNNEDERASVINMWQAMLSAAPAPEGVAVDRLMAVLNYWFDGARRIDRNSEMVKQLAALATRDDAPADPCASHKAEGISLDPCCPTCEAPAEAGEDVQRTISGESVCGFKVAAWQYLGPNDESDAKYGHRYCEHWSTVGAHPKKVVRLFTEDQLRAALRAQPQAREDAQPVAWPEKWSGPCTVGNMIANLRTLPPEMPLYSAYHISMGDKPSLLKVKRPTLSRERVEGNDIKTGDESIPYSAVIWTEPRDFTEATNPAPDALRVALPDPLCIDAVQRMLARFDRAKGRGGYPTANERWAMRECVETLSALQAEQKGGV